MVQLLQWCNLYQHVPPLGGVSEQIQSSRLTLCSNNEIVAKASDAQRYPLPLSVSWDVVVREAETLKELMMLRFQYESI